MLLDSQFDFLFETKTNQRQLKILTLTYKCEQFNITKFAMNLRWNGQETQPEKNYLKRILETVSKKLETSCDVFNFSLTSIGLNPMLSRHYVDEMIEKKFYIYNGNVQFKNLELISLNTLFKQFLHHHIFREKWFYNMKFQSMMFSTPTEFTKLTHDLMLNQFKVKFIKPKSSKIIHPIVTKIESNSEPIINNKIKNHSIMKSEVKSLREIMNEQMKEEQDLKIINEQESAFSPTIYLNYSGETIVVDFWRVDLVKIENKFNMKEAPKVVQQIIHTKKEVFFPNALKSDEYKKPIKYIKTPTNISSKQPTTFEKPVVIMKIFNGDYRPQWDEVKVDNKRIIYVNPIFSFNSLLGLRSQYEKYVSTYDKVKESFIKQHINKHFGWKRVGNTVVNATNSTIYIF